MLNASIRSSLSLSALEMLHDKALYKLPALLYFTLLGFVANL